MAANFRELLLKLCRKEDLSRDEARDAFDAIMTGTATDAQIGGLLVGLAAKGTTVDELVGAASVMRQKVLPVVLDPADKDAVILDTCGTGGDVRGTFNISTAAALVVAAAGVKVVKHGNRSASSKSGSADVLEKIGVKLEVTPECLSRCIKETNICFAFARSHHPAMKFVAQARTSLGIPTIFNLLGPLTNPGGAKHQLLGVFTSELTDRLAAVLRELGSTHAWVVHANDGLDELSTLGPTRVAELKEGQIRSFTFNPSDVGLAYARLSDLQVGTVEESAAIMYEVAANKPGPHRDIVALNAAGALVVAEACPDLPTGLKRAGDAIASGAMKRTLESLVRITQGA